MAIKQSRELVDTSVKTLAKFQSGELKPLKTGKAHLDEALLGGLLPSTVLGICARPTHGKTHDIEEIERNILREARKENDDVVLLRCNWEMEHFKLLVRDLSAQTGKSVKKILFEEQSAEDKVRFKEICDGHRDPNILYQDEPVSDQEFAKDVEQLITSYPAHKIIVTIDNLENVLDVKNNQKKSMDAILYQINRLKKIHPFICFVILNQLNDDYLERMHDIKRQRPIEKDIYGTGQLIKLCDVLYIKIIPAKLGIVDKFMVFGKKQYHWLSDHKISSTTSSKVASFDPFGKVFYFYLKLRQVDNPKDIRDVHIETMYTREEAGVDINSILDEDEKSVDEPFFEERPVIELPKKPLAPGLNGHSNTNFDNNKNTGDAPF